MRESVKEPDQEKRVTERQKETGSMKVGKSSYDSTASGPTLPPPSSPYLGYQLIKDPYDEKRQEVTLRARN